MQTRRWNLLAGGVALIVAAGLAGSAAAQQPLTKITVQTQYTASSPVTPLVYGAAAGIYKKYGLDVEVKMLGGTQLEPNQLVMQGLGQFAYGDSGVLTSLVSQGVPMKAVMGMIQGNANGLAVRTASGIKEAKDLRGKTIAGISNSVSTDYFFDYLKRHGVNPADVKFQALSAAAKNQAFLGGAADGAIAYGIVIKPIYEGLGTPITLLNFGDEVNAIQAIITARNDYIQANPDIVRRFVKATAEAIIATKAHPKEAAQATFDASNGAASKVPVLVEQLAILEYFATKRDAGKPLGWMSEDDWKDTLNASRTFLKLKTDPKLSDLYTNEFVNENPTTPEWAYKK